MGPKQEENPGALIDLIGCVARHVCQTGRKDPALAEGVNRARSALAMSRGVHSVSNQGEEAPKRALLNLVQYLEDLITEKDPLLEQKLRHARETLGLETIDYNALREAREPSPPKPTRMEGPIRYCPACGSGLRPVVPQDDTWFDFCEAYRRNHGTTWVLCTRTTCSYHDMPLVLFSPLGDWSRPTGGDCWAVGYVK